jgi:hypothetical protein
MIKRGDQFRNYLIMFFLLAVSAMPYFNVTQAYIIIGAGVLTVMFFTNKSIKIDKDISHVILALLFVVLLQSLVFSFFKLITIAGLVLRIWVAYLSVKLLKKNFLYYYIGIMRFFCLTSLVIFIPIILYPGLLDKLLSAIPDILRYKYQLWGFEIDRKTIIIYNFNMTIEGTKLIRNCGPFWEPGAFGGFLILAFMFNTVRAGTLLNKLNWLFMITIISTLSTTTYIGLFAFIIIYYLFEKRSIWYRALLIAIGFVGIVGFQTLDFLGAKIDAEQAGVQDAIATKGGNTRLASAYLDWQDIKGYPITGRGIWDETRVDSKFKYVIRNNGLTNFLASWGIIFFTFYFVLYYKNFKIYCRLFNTNRFMPVALIFVIWLMAFSENYFGTPFFWTFVFMSIPFTASLKRTNLLNDSAGYYSKDALYTQLD